ncbi:MAG TPA: adenylate/guanylate cyclase domain-containing protein [Gaiellaceae bacterium]|nr:adenylate/guanylate cyclase domain-containing protein [Gaiellaceae bacterium]
MRELPRGTVTFLFTDIEGSTRLLDELGAEEYGNALAEHRRVLRGAFGRNGGVEVDTQGDAFFVAFPTAPGALEAAREAQDELGLPVRMGLHTGTPLLTDEGYVGTDVHRAARIAAAGHGRQVLVSTATAALVDSSELRDLGEHRLKDLSAPERIFQLGDAEFPPLKTLYRTNLPIPATPFLGREHELGDVRELLVREDARLLTLTGAGGSGKTRLALHAAGEAAEAYPDGVWWVPLAPLADPADVGPAAARALGGGGTLPELVDGRRLLVLLDNFEHVVEAAPDVAAVLAECPRADVLVTSRERLRLQGEHVYPVPVLARAEARRLFVTRARAAQPDFEPDEHLDELCSRLDDLPLALELAAARTSLLSTEQLLERLGNRLDLLRGARDAETRQQTLRATIEWSYELLEPDERTLLAALSVFRGGWTLEAAEQVAGADLDLMQSLVDKSLVRRWESGRFGMLETIREFAAEQLTHEERERLLGRLLEYLLELFDGANLRPHQPGQPRMDFAQEERANADVALRWAAGSDPTAGLRLLERQEMYWFTNDPIRAREHVDALLVAAGTNLDPASHGLALRFRGATFDFVGRPELAEAEYLQGIELLRSIGDEAEALHLTLRVANCALGQGDVSRAKRLIAERLERGGGHRGDEGVALSLLAQIAFNEGDVGEGARLAHESASASEKAGMTWFRCVTLLNTAESLALGGELDVAESDFTDGLRGLWSVQDLVNMPEALVAGSVLAALRADPVRAGTLWGAAEAEGTRRPRPTTTRMLEEFEVHLEQVRGASFEEGRANGRTLSLEDAVAYALGDQT